MRSQARRVDCPLSALLLLTRARAVQVDNARAQLTNINKKMKKTLQSTRSADRFILDFILLVIVLGIAGYVVSMFM